MCLRICFNLKRNYQSPRGGADYVSEPLKHIIEASGLSGLINREWLRRQIHQARGLWQGLAMVLPELSASSVQPRTQTGVQGFSSLNSISLWHLLSVPSTATKRQTTQKEPCWIFPKSINVPGASGPCWHRQALSNRHRKTEGSREWLL